MDEALPDVDGWARRQLGVPLEATPTQARPAVLRALADGEFVPPPEWQEAVEVLYRPSRAPAARGRAAVDEEARLRPEVETFATEYFKLAPPARRERWHALAVQCRPFPRLAARLEVLVPGLEIDLVAFLAREKKFDELAQQVTTLFLLRPPERAARRQALLAAWGDRQFKLEGTARRLQKRFPALAALEPDLAGHLTACRTAEKLLRKSAKQQASARPKSRASVGGGSVVGIWFLILLFTRFLGGLTPHSSVPQTPSYTAPPVPVLKSNWWDANKPGAPGTIPVLPPGSPNTGVPSHLWKSVVPGTVDEPELFPNRPDRMPIPRPGEPGSRYVERLSEWQRRQDPFGRRIAPGLPGGNRAGVPTFPGNTRGGNPAIPGRPWPERPAVPSPLPQLPGRP
jgi:hypothetical protein